MDALGGGTLHLPPGVHDIRGDLIVKSDGLHIIGEGDGTVLRFHDGGLVYDGATAYRSNCQLANLRILRTGTAGPALRLKGGGYGTGVNHFNAANLRASAQNGQAILVDGSYIATFAGCYFEASTIGLEVAADTATRQVYGNNLSFFGGETQGNEVGARINGGVSVNFFGHGIEGNTTSGVEFLANGRANGFRGCYFEGNGGWDIRVGSDPGACIATTVEGCFFNDGGVGKANSIILVRSLATVIEANHFGESYRAAPVNVQEAARGSVTGDARNNMAKSLDGSGIVALNGAAMFNA